MVMRKDIYELQIYATSTHFILLKKQQLHVSSFANEAIISLYKNYRDLFYITPLRFPGEDEVENGRNL